jgi:hypothetical protein
MAGLPRGTCAVCGDNVALRKNGMPREHWVRKVDGRLVAASPMAGGKACKGSGKPAAGAS